MSNDLFSLKGRIALVTGGSRGIGKMIAAGFLGAGAAKVYITARKAGPCEATAKELSAQYDGECIALPIDISTVEGCNKLADEIIKLSGGINAINEYDGYKPINDEAIVAAKPDVVLSIDRGKDSLNAGMAAGLVGLGLVLIYMLIYYRALGAVVLFGLLVSSALLWSIIGYLGEHSGLALSLSGATGIIVSIGVTVDSYVVFFERLKDEIKSGKSIRSSVDRGFTKAYKTIIAADVSSLIGAGLLYYLTVGPVRGFATTLIIGILASLFTSIVVTRVLVDYLLKNAFSKKISV